MIQTRGKAGRQGPRRAAAVAQEVTGRYRESTGMSVADVFIGADRGLVGEERRGRPRVLKLVKGVKVVGGRLRISDTVS